jgi:predicted nucleotidyltransferase
MGRGVSASCETMNKTVEYYRSVLHHQLPVLRKQFHVATLGLFGSYVRGTQRADSDLDVLVTFDELPSLFRLIELENQLGDLLGLKVDLVVRDSLKPRIGERIRREVVPV